MDKVSYKSMLFPKLLRIRFNKTDIFIRIYDGTRYLASLKSSTTYISSHCCSKIKVDSYDSLPTEI